jgi:hypothetical protein
LNGDTKDKGKGRRKGDDVLAVPLTRDDLVKKYKIGTTSLTQARDLLAEAPDLAQQVDACTLSLAGEKAEVEPTFTDYEGDDEGALALVESLNAERRDLTGAQRAIVAAKRWMLSAPNGDTRKRGGDRTKGKLQPEVCTLASLARKYKTAQVSISQARDLLAEAPDLADKAAASPNPGGPKAAVANPFATASWRATQPVDV